MTRGAPATPALFPSGVVCGRFRIEGVLGIGGTGTVFAAVDERDGGMVALKAIPHDAVLRQRARREAAVAGRLDHPHVVRLRDVVEDDDYVYVVSDLVDGGDLAGALKSDSLSTVELLRIVAAVCDALACAHAHGVVHRDVKPANVLLGRDGSVRLADFGIAVLAEPDATVDDRLLGTLSYMAPETCTGAPPAAPADVWAVGVLLYEALTGANPFRSRRPGELRELHAEGARPLAEVRSDLPAAVLSACDRALSRNPRRRPSPAALRDALNAGADRLGGPRDTGARVVQLHPRRRTLRLPALPSLPRPAVGGLGTQLSGLAGSSLDAALATGASPETAARLAELTRRVGPAVCAGVAALAIFDAFPFWPHAYGIAIALAAAALALVAPWAAAALVAATAVPALGDVSAGLAWCAAALAVGWLALSLGAGRRALLPALAPLLALTPFWPLYVLAAAQCRTPAGRALAGAAGPLAVALWAAGPGAAAGVAGIGDASVVARALLEGAGGPLLAHAALWGAAAATFPLAWQARSRGIATAAWLGALLAGQALLPQALGVGPATLLAAAGGIWLTAILLVLSVPARETR